MACGRLGTAWGRPFLAYLAVVASRHDHHRALGKAMLALSRREASCLIIWKMLRSMPFDD